MSRSVTGSSAIEDIRRLAAQARTRAISARLRFNADAARRVRDETGHPQQRLLPDGDGLILDAPYSQSRERVVEILRYGSDVERFAPATLRDTAHSALATAPAQYAAPNTVS